MKNTLPPFPTINGDGDMSADITSPVTDIRFIDNVALLLKWTGTPVGTFAVQGSVDYVAALPNASRVANAGTWTSLTLSPTPSAAGSADHVLIDLPALGFPFIRVVYTRTSGTGTLTMYISGKAV